MTRSGFGVGMIVLLVALLIVMLLAVKAWHSVPAEAVEAATIPSTGAPDDHGQVEAGQELRSGELPRLHDTLERTDRYGAQTQKALDEIE